MLVVALAQPSSMTLSFTSAMFEAVVTPKYAMARYFMRLVGSNRKVELMKLVSIFLCLVRLVFSSKARGVESNHTNIWHIEGRT